MDEKLDSMNEIACVLMHDISTGKNRQKSELSGEKSNNIDIPQEKYKAFSDFQLWMVKSSMCPSENTTIRQAQNRVKTFLDSRPKNWSQIDNHFYTFTHMTEEIGELARHIINVELRLSSDRTTVDSVQEKNLHEIKDDLGDIFYALLKMAIGYNIDLEEAFDEAMSSIEKRYSTKTN